MFVDVLYAVMVGETIFTGPLSPVGCFGIKRYQDTLTRIAYIYVGSGVPGGGCRFIVIMLY